MKQYKTAAGTEVILVMGGRSNVFLVRHDNKNILVDSGPAFKRDRLFRNLQTLGIERIDYLVLTHAHFDHAGNAAAIKAQFGAQAIIHKSEADFFSNGDNTIIKGTNPFTKTIVGLVSRPFKEKLKYDPCIADIAVGEKMDLMDAGFNIYVIHTPGHTSGSMSVVVDNELAMVGDALFGVIPRSVMPPYGEDIPGMVKSWGKLLDTGCNRFLPSHGSEISRALLEKRIALKL